MPVGMQLIQPQKLILTADRADCADNQKARVIRFNLRQLWKGLTLDCFGFRVSDFFLAAMSRRRSGPGFGFIAEGLCSSWFN